MFVRKKKNRSGSTSIVVIDKSHGKYKEVKTIGSSTNANEIALLYEQGQKWISVHCGNRDLFVEHDRQIEEQQVTECFLSNIENILLNGTQLILNLEKVIECIGCLVSTGPGSYKPHDPIPGRYFH